MASPNTPSATTRFGIFVLIGGVTLVFILWGILHYLADNQHPALRVAATRPGTSTPAASATPAASVNPADADRAAAMAQLNGRVSQALAVLRDPNITDLKAKQAALDALKEALRGADPKVAVAVIRQFLTGKEDAKTGLAFTMGDEHELESAPTMRTFMMDQLGDISLGASLGDAMEAARETLQTKDSPDEWALALRNLALGDPDGSRGLVTAKSRELLEYAPWQQAPTGGYLEAFDAAVYAKDPAIIADLGTMLSSPNSMLAGATRVALQRMSSYAPAEIASYLNANPGALADYPNLRADYMGGVDLSAPAQLSQAETYLERTDVTDAEKSKFIGRLGLPAAFVSNTLITPEDIVQMPIMDHRALVNRTATQWLDSGKYPNLQTALQNVISSTGDSGSTAGQ